MLQPLVLPLLRQLLARPRQCARRRVRCRTRRQQQQDCQLGGRPRRQQRPAAVARGWRPQQQAGAAAAVALSQWLPMMTRWWWLTRGWSRLGARWRRWRQSCGVSARDSWWRRAATPNLFKSRIQLWIGLHSCRLQRRTRSEQALLVHTVCRPSIQVVRRAAGCDRRRNANIVQRVRCCERECVGGKGDARVSCVVCGGCTESTIGMNVNMSILPP